MNHDHETIIIDSDKHFVIDPITRAINTESPKLKLMQYDHKSERYTFEIPKIIEGHDMSLCDSIKIHYLNSGSSGKHGDVYEVDDIGPMPDNPDKLLFSWLIKNTCTKFAGTLGFAIRFYCILDDGVVDYSWGTDLFTKITVSNGMENTEQIIEDYSDLITQIQKEIEELGFVVAQPKDLIVTGVSDQIQSSNNPLSSTYEQIKEAINSEKNCYLLYDESIKIPLRIDGENISGTYVHGLDVYSITIYPEDTYDFQISNIRATGDKVGGFKAWNTDGTYHGVPIEIDPNTSFAYAALNISDKTGDDTGYTEEVKKDPTTKKMFVKKQNGLSEEQAQRIEKNTQDISSLSEELDNQFPIKSIIYSRNRIDNKKIQNGILAEDGSIDANSVMSQSYVTSDYINITSLSYRLCYWDIDRVTSAAIRMIGYFDEKKSLIKYKNSSSPSTGDLDNVDAIYIRICFSNTIKDTAMFLMGDTSTKEINGYIPYSMQYSRMLSEELYRDTEEKIIKKISEETAPSTTTYKIIANGDSITYGHKPSISGYENMDNGVSYITLACQELGYELNNYSISSSALAVTSDGTDKHNALVNRYLEMPSDADLVWIAIGSNDWFYDYCELGTMDDRGNNTFYGAMHILCAGLKEKYPLIPIIFATPIKRWIIRESSNIEGNLNLHREPITEICNAIKDVCNYYGIPVVDMYSESYLNPWIEEERIAYIPDGTHPNLNGHNRMKITCKSVLKKYLI